jgi:uncharacterized membrane protein
MYKALLSTTALAAILTSHTGLAHAVDAAQEPCFGLASIGKNDCANLTGTHGCAGMASTNQDSSEWIYVDTVDDCIQLGGLSKVQAEAALNIKAKAAITTMDSIDTAAIENKREPLPNILNVVSTSHNAAATPAIRKAVFVSNED